LNFEMPPKEGKGQQNYQQNAHGTGDSAGRTSWSAALAALIIIFGGAAYGVSQAEGRNKSSHSDDDSSVNTSVVEQLGHQQPLWLQRKRTSI
jgi:hypothetical protein